MKKVIFICLLSIAACLSAPTEQTPPAPAQPNKDASPHDTKPAVTPTATTTNATAPAKANPDVNTTVVPTPDKQKTTPEENKTKPDESKSKTDPAKDGKDKVTEKPPSTPTASTHVTPPAEHEKTPNTTTKPTEAPKPTVPTKPTETPSKEGDKIVQARGFDGASFVGGIILTLGLLAIGFMGFKYYKNHTERNYHTL